MSGRALAVLLACGLAACAPKAVVVVSGAYEPSRVQRVTLATLADYPGAAGSGAIASDTLEKYLLQTGYRLVERRQAEQILREHDFSPAGETDPAELKQVGTLLGVDALVLGSVTDYTGSRDQTVLVDMPQEQTEPIYGQVVTTRRDGDERVRTTENVVTGYAITRTSQIVPQTETVPAHVALSLRLVDAASGEVLWSASSSAGGPDLPSALEAASASAMKETAKQLKKQAKAH
jgi:hypothetical protein